MTDATSQHRPTETIYLALGCFWGAEELFWQLPGVVSTRVGYMGGTVPNPSYELVCTGTTGHAETVEVVYDPALVDVREVLRAFWEHHDPTQGDRQGNDVGSQYRSAVFATTDEQLAVADSGREAYGVPLREAGYGPVTTEVTMASSAGEFQPAEEYHQRYLEKHPHGYRCHAQTGVPFPG